MNGKKINDIYEINEMKVTRQTCNIPLLKYMKNEGFFFFESRNCPKYLLSLKHKRSY